MNITLGQLVLWILAYRRGNAFKEYSELKIASEIYECAEKNTMLYVVDEDGIVGIICFEENEEEKKLHIFDLLTIKEGVVKTMLTEFHRRYDGWIIEGWKNHEIVTFRNTHKLENLI